MKIIIALTMAMTLVLGCSGQAPSGIPVEKTANVGSALCQAIRTSYSWSDGQAPVVMAAANSHYCWLNGIGGQTDFNTGVHITIDSNNNYVLGANFVPGTGGRAGAFCITLNAFGVCAGHGAFSYTGQPPFNTTCSGPSGCDVTLLPDTSFCNVRGASGKFVGELTDVSTFYDFGNWSLGVAGDPNQMEGEAGCMSFAGNTITKLPAPGGPQDFVSVNGAWVNTGVNASTAECMVTELAGAYQSNNDWGSVAPINGVWWVATGGNAIVSAICANHVLQ